MKWPSLEGHLFSLSDWISSVGIHNPAINVHLIIDAQTRSDAAAIHQVHPVLAGYLVFFRISFTACLF